MTNDSPKPFTQLQRELFQKVANLNRGRPGDFADADVWIDTRPLTAVEERKQYREQIGKEIAERQQRKDRSWLPNVPGEVLDRWRRWAPSETNHQDKARVLMDWRRDRARAIRYALQCFAENIQEEEKHGPILPCSLIDLKASRFIHTSDPIVFDAMNPQQKTLWARRLLRVVWILTDTSDLNATKLPWLREWKWGEHPLEFLNELAGGEPRPIPRLYSRVTILDRDLEEWERLTQDALHSLDEDGPTATSHPFAPVADDLAKPTGTLSKEARALAALADHPEWPDSKIAAIAGCARTQLYRMSKYKIAKAVMKAARANIPKGSKNVETGIVDAWDEDA